MSIIDKQIVNALRHIHRDNHFGSDDKCRWYYNSKKDTYECQHINIQGREVIAHVRSREGFTED